MNNKKIQKDSTLILALLATTLAAIFNLGNLKIADVYLRCVTIMTAAMFILGYNLFAKEYYISKNSRIKWNFEFLGLSKVDWTKYDFHITPVLTFTKVIHPTNLAHGHCISIEWGHWAYSIRRFIIKNK